MDPVPLLQKFGVDSLRYTLLRDGLLESDASFSAAGPNSTLLKAINCDLCDAWGNLVSRATGRVCLPDGAVPRFHSQRLNDADRALLERMQQTVTGVAAHFDALRFKNGLELLSQFVAAINLYFQSQQPWVLRCVRSPLSCFSLPSALE